MIVLKVTSKIKNGELMLATLSGPVKAGMSFTLSEDKFYSSDIQQALRTDYIEIVSNDKNYKMPNRIELKNLLARPLSVSDISFQPYGSKFISEEKLYDTIVQDALAQGVIEKVGLETVEETLKTVKKVAKKIAKKSAKAKKAKKAKVSKSKKSKVKKKTKKVKKNAEESKTTLHSWDPFSEELMDKDASRKNMNFTEDGHIPDKKDGNIQVGDIDFDDDKPKKNTTRKKKTTRKKTTKKASKKKTTKKSSKKKTKSRKKSTQKSKPVSLKPVGRHRPEPKADDGFGPQIVSSALPNEVEGFVDQEQQQQRIAGHPLLSQNTEID